MVERSGRPLRRARAFVQQAPLLHARLDRFRARGRQDADARARRSARPARGNAALRGRGTVRLRLRRGEDRGLNSRRCVRSRAAWGGSARRRRSRSSRGPARSRPRDGTSSTWRSASPISIRRARSSPRASRRSIAAEPGMADRTIVLDGFSKTFAMTGWRLGYGAFPKTLVDPVTKLVTNSVSCTATFTQRAGVVAISQRPVEVDLMLAEFRRRRDAIVTGLAGLEGVTCRVPRGAFYVFPNIKALGLGDAATVANRVLNEAGVAVLAGTAFGAAGEGYLRLSYANSLENLNAAVQRIGDWSREARSAAIPTGR